MLTRLRSDAVEWAVPGLLQDRVAALVKALPRDIRRRLIPIPQAVEKILGELKRGEGSLPAALSECLKRIFWLDVPLSAWNVEGLPERLKLRYAVVDPKGNELRSTRDLETLRKDRLEEEESRAFGRARAAWERKGAVRWVFPDLPEEIPEEIRLDAQNVLEGTAYPALVPAGEGVDLRLLRNRREAEEAHRAGVKKLLSLRFRKDLDLARRYLTLRGEMKVWSAYFGGTKVLEDSLFQGLLHRLLEKDIRTAAGLRRVCAIPRAGPPQGTPGAARGSGARPAGLPRDAPSPGRPRGRKPVNRTVLNFLEEMRTELQRLLP